MLRVPSSIPVDMIAHVDEFFRDHQFDCPRFRLVDASQIDQDRVTLPPR
jgi:hypothetical protein